MGRGGVCIPASSVRSTLSDHVMDGLQRAAAAAGCSGSWKLVGRFFCSPFGCGLWIGRMKGEFVRPSDSDRTLWRHR